jgi:hypothetical protein
MTLPWQSRWLLPLSMLACQNAPARPAVSDTAPATPIVEKVELRHFAAQGQLGPGRGQLLIDLTPPVESKLTPDAPVLVRGSGGVGLAFPEELKGPLAKHSLPLKLPIEVADGATGPAEIELAYFWCKQDNQASCRREHVNLQVALDLTGDSAGGEALVTYRTRED